MMLAQGTGESVAPTTSNLGARRGWGGHVADSSTKYSVAREQCKMNPVWRFHGHNSYANATHGT